MVIWSYGHMVPLEHIHSDIGHMVPLEHIHSDIGHMVPLEHIHSDIGHNYGATGNHWCHWEGMVDDVRHGLTISPRLRCGLLTAHS